MADASRDTCRLEIGMYTSVRRKYIHERNSVSRLGRLCVFDLVRGFFGWRMFAVSSYPRMGTQMVSRLASGSLGDNTDRGNEKLGLRQPVRGIVITTYRSSSRRSSSDSSGTAFLKMRPIINKPFRSSVRSQGYRNFYLNSHTLARFTSTESEASRSLRTASTT